MAYTLQQAVDLVKLLSRNVPLTGVDSQLVDLVDSIMYRYYPWKFAQKTMTAIPLVDAQQDYSIAGVTDWYRPVYLRITKTSTTPDQYQSLDIMSHLEPELQVKTAFPFFSSIAVIDETTKVLRLATAASVPSGTTLQIEGAYQVIKTQIEDAQLAGSSAWIPEHYFDVLVEGLKWKVWQMVDDPRAGSVVVDRRGNRQYTGQLGVFWDALQDMAAAEDAGDGMATMTPAEPLAEYARGAPTVYGI